MFWEQFNTIDYILLGALIVLFIAQVYWYIRYLAAPARSMRRDKKECQLSTVNCQLPGVSVIICAHNESYNLSQYLQALLTQDYPEFEVIIVDDGSEDGTRAVVESYMLHDPRLHMTFVPYGARVQSTKKLAITLGAKAAQYDYLLLTDADCIPESNQWIREMMNGFEMSTDHKQMSTVNSQDLTTSNNRALQGKELSTDKCQLSTVNCQLSTDIVLGFSPYFEEPGHINRLVRFDTLFNGLHYLGAALCGHPYMGVGRNLAYRKSLFFESGGFTHQMTNRAGDDDLFVNHLATRENTAVVLDRNAYTWSVPKTSFKAWWQQKRRHISVSPAYKPATKFRLALEPLTRGLFYLAVLGVVIYQLYIVHCTLYIPLLAAVGLFIARWIIQTAVINTSARRMGIKPFNMFTVLWFDITLPLVNLWMLCVPKKYKW